MAANDPQPLNADMVTGEQLLDQMMIELRGKHVTSETHSYSEGVCRTPWSRIYVDGPASSVPNNYVTVLKPELCCLLYLLSSGCYGCQ